MKRISQQTASLLWMLVAVMCPVALVSAAANITAPTTPKTEVTAAVWWVVGAAAVVPSAVATINGVMTIVQRMRKQGPVNIAIASDPQSYPRTRGDCIAIHEKDREWIRRVEESSRHDLKAETDKVQQRIDTLHTSVNAQFTKISSQLGRISGRLDLREEGSGI